MVEPNYRLPFIRIAIGIVLWCVVIAWNIYGAFAGGFTWTSAILLTVTAFLMWQTFTLYRDLLKRPK
jgi:hypothetical protein